MKKTTWAPFMTKHFVHFYCCFFNFLHIFNPKKTRSTSKGSSWLSFNVAETKTFWQVNLVNDFCEIYVSVCMYASMNMYIHIHTCMNVSYCAKMKLKYDFCTHKNVKHSKPCTLVFFFFSFKKVWTTAAFGPPKMFFSFSFQLFFVKSCKYNILYFEAASNSVLIVAHSVAFKSFVQISKAEGVFVTCLDIPEDYMPWSHPNEKFRLYKHVTTHVWIK